MWTELKTFVQEVYTRHLKATNITAGQHGYVQNAYAALAEDSTEEDDDDGVKTVITQMAALTTQSQLTVASHAATTSSVMNVINQLAANQKTMEQQITAFAARAPPTAVQFPTQAAVQFPTQFNIPPIGNYHGGGTQAARRVGRGRGDQGERKGQSGG